VPSHLIGFATDSHRYPPGRTTQRHVQDLYTPKFSFNPDWYANWYTSMALQFRAPTCHMLGFSCPGALTAAAGLEYTNLTNL
jgi:hypothetical protein